MLHRRHQHMRAVGWRVRVLGSGEGEGWTVFLCSCVLAARRGRLRGRARGCGCRSVVLATFLMVSSHLNICFSLAVGPGPPRP